MNELSVEREKQIEEQQKEFEKCASYDLKFYNASIYVLMHFTIYFLELLF